MALTLSLPPQSLIRRTVSDTQCHQSSLNAAEYISVSAGDRVSTWSMCHKSFASLKPAAECAKDKDSPPKSLSHSFLSLFDPIDIAALPITTATLPSRKSSWSTCFSENSRCSGLFVINGSQITTNLNFDSTDENRLFDREHGCGSGSILGLTSQIPSLKEERGTSDKGEKRPDRLYPPLPDNVTPQATEPVPFRRWMSTLRRKTGQRRRTVIARKERWVFDDFDEQKLSNEPLIPSFDHRRSKSGTSSMQFIRAVKSTSITIASTSVAQISRRGARLARVMSENRSSRLSENRDSLDSTAFSVGVATDIGALTRSIQRRNILEELINSERGYISDLRSLESSYYDVGKSETSLLPNSRCAIRNMITQILQLHEELLAELDRMLPDVELPYVDSSAVAITPAPCHRPRHARWHSADFVSVRASGSKLRQRIRHSLDGSKPVGVNFSNKAKKASPETVATIARVFNRYMNRFLIYEEYAAQYDIMCQDFTNACRVERKWHSYERGVEILSNTIRSLDSRMTMEKKSLTFLDLLIKPVQRICKYPLLFADLCKQTPVCDGPESYAELEKVWFRLKETTEEINRATDDEGKRKLIAITWLLQDKLLLEDDISQSTILRRLGHVYACGVLHIAYQRPDNFRGQYMLCALFRRFLVLAVSNRQYSRFKLVASISLKNAAVERSDNGKGLQCHNAPYSWKLVFEHDRNIFEILVTACSASEEDAWKSSIQARIKEEAKEPADDRQSLYEPLKLLTLNIKPVSPAFDQRIEFLKQRSIQRAATVGSTTNISRVMVKNTQAQKGLADEHSAKALAIGRSQSVLSTKHIPTLLPRRIDRVRLEMALSDIWTRDVIPYPGMLSRRSETSIRASANLMMRKLSMASITSGFSKRSTSFTSLNSNHRSNDTCPLVSKVPAPALRKTQRPSGMRRSTAPVDFHNAPKAFLPEDFDIQQANSASKRQRVLGRSVIDSQTFESPLVKDVLSVPHFRSPTGGDNDNGYNSCRIRKDTPTADEGADQARDKEKKECVASPSQQVSNENSIPSLDGQSEGIASLAKRSISGFTTPKVSPARAFRSSKKKFLKFWY